MPAPQCIVRFRQQDRTVLFRIEGRGTMTQSIPLRRQAERFVETGIDHIQVDLHDCSYLDSTFLGTLLTVKKMLDRIRGLFTLVAPSQACVRILQQMGLADVLATQPLGIEPATAWTELPCEPPDLHTFKRTVAQAHEELANLPGAAGDQFKAAIRCLEQADKAPSPAPPAPRPTE